MPDNFTGKKSYIKQVTLSLLLFVCGVCILYPFCRYYVDPDGAAYLVIIKRYADGDFVTAANGLWSPFHCWLSALLVKLSGMGCFDAALAVNCAGGLSVIMLSQHIFNRFRSGRTEQWCMALFSGIYWAYAMYWQLLCDVLGVAFLLSGILVLLKEDFFEKRKYWILFGILNAFAYLSKTYSFYFINLLLLIILGLSIRRKEIRPAKALSLYLTNLFIILIIASPWIWLLHEKYHIWTLSLAGKLNMDWLLVGTQIFRDDIKVLVPPPFPGSVVYMEDPYWVQGGWHHLWDSPKLFFRFFLRIAFNFTEWTEEINHLSYFYGITWLTTFLLLLSRKRDEVLDRKDKLMALILLVFPVGLWLLHIEARYLWLTLPVAIILGLKYFERFLFPYLSGYWKHFFIAFYFLSFLPGAAADVRTMVNTGKAEYQVAQKLKELDIKGAFACNKASASGMLSSVIRLAYFSDCPFYYYPYAVWSTGQIIEDAKRYHVKYYFYFYTNPDDGYVLTGKDGVPFPELTGGRIEGLKVFRLEN